MRNTKSVEASYKADRNVEEPARNPTEPVQRRRNLRPFLLGLFAVLILAILALSLWSASRPHRADPNDVTQVSLGRQVYAAQCARCHGANLEGQPNWKEPLPTGGRPAPPHDETGHTWHHPDQLLFKIVKHGSALYAGPGEELNMPAFGGVLSDEEIWAVLAYIKSTWPADIREMQEQVNQHAR